MTQINLKITSKKAPSRGTALSWQWGLWARDLTDPIFRDSKGRNLLRVPHFGPQNPALGGAKISGDPLQNMCLHERRLRSTLIYLAGTLSQLKCIITLGTWT